MNTCSVTLSSQSSPASSWSAALLAALLTVLFVWTFSHSTAEVRWLGSTPTTIEAPAA